ncbi:RDD family protein [Pseudonocardia sp.]|uniref:RDD family protein n=1 Tax=Pseudonocardia sp. TaxID=60912 RepID=UPI003D0C0648
MSGGDGSDVPTTATAGIVTRTLAAVADLVVVVVLMGLTLVVVAGVRFLASPPGFRWPSPTWPQSLVVGGLLATAYLTVAWSTSGRSCGAALLGLRIRPVTGAHLGWLRAGLRAVLCVVFPLGLLWAVLGRRRRSLQDLLTGTVVVYDPDLADAYVSPPGGGPGGAEPGHRRGTRVEEEPR